MARAFEHHSSGPLFLDGDRLRCLPGVDVEFWAMEELRKIVLEAVGNLGIDVYLFGSRARGDAHSLSDADLAVDNHGETVATEWLAHLREQLEQSLIPFTVDIIDLAAVNPAFIRAVQEDGIKWTS